MKRIMCFILCVVLCIVGLSACTKKGDLKVEDIYDTASHITLGKYIGVEVEVSYPLQITDEDIEDSKYIKLIELSEETVEITDRPIQKWDNVTFTYSAYMGDELIDESAEEGQTIVVGADYFLPEFEDALIGMNIGQSSDITVTFPESWSNTELAGLDVTFKVTIVSVSENILPEFDDEFVFKNFGYSNTGQFYEKQKVALQEERDELIKNEKMSIAWQKVVENTDIRSYPPETYSSYLNDAVNYYTQYAAYYAWDDSEISSSADAQAKALLGAEMVAYAILSKEKVTITAEEIASYKQLLLESQGYEDEADFFNQTGTEFTATYGEDYLEKYYVLQRAMEFCGENAVIKSDIL